VGDIKPLPIKCDDSISLAEKLVHVRYHPVVPIVILGAEGYFGIVEPLSCPTEKIVGF
jgi:hypothetical protein